MTDYLLSVDSITKALPSAVVTANQGTVSGKLAAGDDSRITGSAQKASNLSDLANAGTARTNLGLGDAATKSVGTTAGTVKAGDYQPTAANISDSTAAGRALLTAADIAAQRSSLGVAVGLNGKPVKVVACVLRPTALGVWQFIDDGLHDPIGVASLTQDATSITVTFDQTFGRVLSFAVTPDEYMQSINITAGASVSGSVAIINLSKQATTIGAYISWNGSAWVVSGDPTITVASYTAGVLTLNHTEAFTATYAASVGRRDANYQPRLGSLGSTTSTLSWYTDAGVLVTTADTSCKTYFTRTRPTLKNLDPATTDITLNLNAGNIWVLGVFEAA